MVTALLAVVVASVLGITVARVSIHANETSSYDRSRTLAVHAAEAGLDEALAVLQTTGTAALPCSRTGALTGTPQASWSVVITYYASAPPSGAPMACAGPDLGGTTAPASATLLSTGSVASFPSETIDRHMETLVTLSPIYGGFDKAIFSNNSPTLNNALTINGNNGNNGDFYTNGSWNCANSITVNGNVYAQGSMSMANSCRVAGDAWANGNTTMANSARVDHDLKSSTGSLTMANSSHVGNDVTVGTTCTGCTTARVSGSVTTGNVQSAPPASAFPAISFDSSAWTAAGYSIEYFTDCTAARSWMTSGANVDSKTVVRITGGCTLSFANNTTVTRTENLAIFTDGEITTANNTTFTSGDSSWYDLHLIVQSGASCADSNGRITMSNLTTFTKLRYFVYSPCLVSFANNNSGAQGQIYGNSVSLANLLTFTYYPMLVPGAGPATGYTANMSFVREVN